MDNRKGGCGVVARVGVVLLLLGMYLEYLFHTIPRTSSRMKMMMTEFSTTIMATAQLGILRMISGSLGSNSTPCVCVCVFVCVCECVSVCVCVCVICEKIYNVYVNTYTT